MTVRALCDLCWQPVAAENEYEVVLCWECAKKEEEW